MDENAILNKPSDKWFKIIITQSICILIILISVLVVKFFFKGSYTKLEAFYKENICSDTDIDEVLKAGSGEINEI